MNRAVGAPPLPPQLVAAPGAAPLPVRILGGADALALGTPVRGTVAARSDGGVLLVDTAHGRLQLAGAPALPEGSAVALRRLAAGGAAQALLALLPGRVPAGATAPAPAPHPAPPAAAGLAALRRGWPALQDLVHVVSRGAPSPTMAPPRSGEELLARLLAFVSAVRREDPRQWLGAETVRVAAETEAGRSAFARVAEDLSRLARLAEPGGDWQTWLMPLGDGPELRQIRFHFRAGGGADGEEEAKRFVVDLELSRLGPLQLDGLYRNRRLGLVLRSARALPPRLAGDIEAIFTAHLAGAGMQGELRFEPGGRFVDDPLRALAAGSTVLSV